MDINQLSDEQVLKEFVKRFDCDGAVLIYLDEKMEYGFGRWQNRDGRQWVNQVFNAVKSEIQGKAFTTKAYQIEKNLNKCLNFRKTNYEK